MTRGMPLVMQLTWGSLPWPPFAWSLMLASRIAWYSGVSGAFWPRPAGLRLIPLGADPLRPLPLAAPIRILGLVERRRA